VPGGWRQKDRCVVCLAAGGRGQLRRRGRRLPQHQHRRGAEQGMTSLAETLSCLDGYDPNALHVDKAREAIRSCLVPIAETETVKVREALGRVLAEEIVPRINVPAHDNSAMDGYAVCSSDPRGEERGLPAAGTAPAARPFGGKERGG